MTRLRTIVSELNVLVIKHNIEINIVFSDEILKKDSNLPTVGVKNNCIFEFLQLAELAVVHRPIGQDESLTSYHSYLQFQFYKPVPHLEPCAGRAADKSWAPLSPTTFDGRRAADAMLMFLIVFLHFSYFPRLCYKCLPR